MINNKLINEARSDIKLRLVITGNVVLDYHLQLITSIESPSNDISSA